MKQAYIEHCCADRQLPQLLAGSEAFRFFATNGDVLIGHLLNAVSFLAGESHILLLAMPQIDIDGLRTLSRYMQRGWTRALMLITREAQEELVSAELEKELDRVQYASDPMVIDGLMAIVPADPERGKIVVIQGAMLTEKDFTLCQYAAYCGRQPAIAAGAMEPLVSKMRVKSRIDHRDNPDIARILNREYAEETA